MWRLLKLVLSGWAGLVASRIARAVGRGFLAQDPARSSLWSSPFSPPSSFPLLFYTAGEDCMVPGSGTILGSRNPKDE